MLYADTSALLPFYRAERNSPVVEAIFMQNAGQIGLSHLVCVEAVSAIARWCRMGDMNEPQAQEIEVALQSDIAAGRYCQIVLSAGVFNQALAWLSLRKASLRTLDALHLAAAAQNEACLLTADQQLARAAEIFGVDCQALG